MPPTATQTIRVGHSPDPDDAFMFYAMTQGKIPMPGVQVEHVLEDIETLNQRAVRGELEVTAFSLHAYAYCAAHYKILTSGTSMGDGYGPIVDRKSTRLNSSHSQISYAVFCLKKKKTNITRSLSLTALLDPVTFSASAQTV